MNMFTPEKYEVIYKDEGYLLDFCDELIARSYNRNIERRLERRAREYALCK